MSAVLGNTIDELIAPQLRGGSAFSIPTTDRLEAAAVLNGHFGTSLHVSSSRVQR